MNLEFHYYTMYFLAQKAGFGEKDCHTLAYSCQYLDNNLIIYEISTPQGPYTTFPTQNFGFWEDRFSEEIFLPYHFFPGDISLSSQPRKDGQSNEFSVTPNSPGAKAILLEALRSKNLYRMGIAFHTYADTWAHQNFTGLREKWNALESGSAIPPIGHAQALRHPDIFDDTWTDSRLTSSFISNRVRFREAAGKIYRYLCTFNHRDFTDELTVLDLWESLFSSARPGDEIESRMVDFVLQCSMPIYNRKEWVTQAVVLDPKAWNDESFFKGFDKILWLADEVLYRNKILTKQKLPSRDDFFQSDLYNWMEAAKVQKQVAHSWLDEHLTGWRDRIL